MTSTPVQTHRSLRFERPQPLRHTGPCGERRQCWHETCRNEYGQVRTIEILPSGDVLAYCHGGTRERRTVEAIA